MVVKLLKMGARDLHIDEAHTAQCGIFSKNVIELNSNLVTD